MTSRDSRRRKGAAWSGIILLALALLTALGVAGLFALGGRDRLVEQRQS